MRNRLVRGDTQELFDAATNTIYIASQKELAASHPVPIKVVSKARLRKLTQGSPRDLDASLRYWVTKSGPGYAVIATKEGAKRFREQRAQAQDSSGGDEQSTSRSAPRFSRSSIPGAPR